MASIIVPTPLGKFTNNTSRLTVKANTIQEMIIITTGENDIYNSGLRTTGYYVRKFLSQNSETLDDSSVGTCRPYRMVL